jgi:hypothetical protein
MESFLLERAPQFEQCVCAPDFLESKNVRIQGADTLADDFFRNFRFRRDVIEWRINVHFEVVRADRDGSTRDCDAEADDAPEVAHGL